MVRTYCGDKNLGWWGIRNYTVCGRARKLKHKVSHHPEGEGGVKQGVMSNSDREGMLKHCRGGEDKRKNR